MLKDVKSGSFTIAAVNEDAYGYEKTCAWVLDGSTGLNGKRLVAGEKSSDAQWYAQCFSEFLRDCLPCSQLPLPEIFSKGVAHVWEEFEKKAGGKVMREDIPCVLGAALRIQKGKIEYITVGDCCLLLRFRNGEVREFLDHAICDLDAGTIRAGLTIAKKENLPFNKCYQQMLPELRRVRLQKNMPEGYIALADDPETVRYAQCGSFPLEELQDFCLLSDGFRSYYELYQICSAEAFIEEAEGKEPQMLFRNLLSIQKSDPVFQKYPRFKLSDDATMIYGKF